MRGLRARGAAFDLKWQDGRLTEANIESMVGRPCRLRLERKTIDLRIARVETYEVNSSLEAP